MIFSVPLREKEKKNIMKKTENTPISKSANSNFGPWGWFIILFALLSFMFAGNLIVDGLNITVAAFTELRGWESGVLLSCSTVAGLVAIVGCVILSNCVCRFGVKAVYCVSLAVVCCCCMVWGSVTQLWQYILILILVNVFGNGFGFVGGTAILANWFPQKKGLAMGWATIGFQASAVALLPAFQWLLERYNLKVAYRLMGLCLLALLMVCLFLVKGDPEDRGCAPDNDWSHSLEEYQQLHRAALKQEKTHRWTTLRLLKTKQMWQIGLVNGLVQMAITVLIVQFIPNLINCGFSANAATLIYSVASVIGCHRQLPLGSSRSENWREESHRLDVRISWSGGSPLCLGLQRAVRYAGAAHSGRFRGGEHFGGLIQLCGFLHCDCFWTIRLR